MKKVESECIATIAQASKKLKQILLFYMMDFMNWPSYLDADITEATEFKTNKETVINVYNDTIT